MRAAIFTVELYADEMSLHVGVRNPVREPLFLLFVGVVAIAAVTSAVSTAAAAGTLGSGEGVIDGESVNLWNEVVAGVDSFQAFLDGIPVIGPLELPILP